MSFIRTMLLCGMISWAGISGAQNIPGGGTGTGPNVTVTDNGGTVVLNNGIVAITINKTSATITSYTYKGINLFAGGHGGGSFYWSWNMPAFGGPNGTYTLTTNPSANGGNYAEVHIHSPWSGNTADAAMDVDVYYSLTRGAQGYYVTATLSHPASYPNNPGGEWRCNTYIGSIFDWLSVDPLRNRMMASPADGAAALPVAGAPKEVIQLTSGIYKGQTECKYAYSADLGDLNVWGWTSTTKKVGIWMTVPSHEYYNGGPMKRELTGHNGHTLLNMLGGEHYAMGNKYNMGAGQATQKTFGPFLVYANSYTGAASDPVATVANTLWKDAQAQALAEQSAWPYTWFKNPAYVQESGRGTVKGTLKINDNTNPAASAAGMWIGLAPNDNGTDFQYQASTYQYWVKTDANGNFTIPHVIAGTYNLWAFGPGAAGTFKQLNVAVAAGQTVNMNTVSWVPTRTGPTVWEIGIPDRDTKEFKNGHPAQIVQGVLPPYTVWGTFQQPTDNQTYTVGQSNWATDWNYVQYTANATVTWKIKFNLAKAPTTGSQAALYLAFAADFGGPVVATVNGTAITSASGFSPAQQADAMVRLGSHGAFGDTRITFAGSLLKAGANEVDLTMRKSGGDAMYDYLRLEASGVTGVTTCASSITTTTPTAFCQGGSVVLTASAGSTYKWFNGTTQVGTGNTYTAIASGSYTVQVTDAAACTATSAVTAVTVNAPPSAPSVTPQLSYCQNATAAMLTANGSSLKWYTTATGGTSSTTAPIPSTSNTGTTNYYVSQTTNTCESTRAMIAVTVNALPAAPAVTASVSYCQNATAAMLTANGSSLKWYTTATGGAALTAAPTPSTVNTGTANYYVSQTGNGCESARAMIAVTVNALPAATITTGGSTTVCQGGVVALTSSAGSSYIWKNGTATVGANQTYNANSNGNYTVEVTNAAGCKKTSAATMVTVNAPTTWYADTDNDGKGDPNVTQSACIKPTGYVSAAGDACPADANKTSPGNCGCGNTENSCLDCAGVPNGTAAVDACQVCSGGTTGITPVTDASNCTTTATQASQIQGLEIYPNPYEQEMVVRVPNGPFTLTIYNAVGVEVVKGMYVKETYIGQDLMPGMYLLRIEQNGIMDMRKVIKK